MMKKLGYLFILVFFNFNIIAQENNTLYVMIDNSNKSLYKFKTNMQGNQYYSSIKILKDEHKKNGFMTKKDASEKKDDDIIIVKTQPVAPNYYEFESYKKPKKITNIDTLKKYSIKDISKNTAVFKEFWRNYTISIIFIEKKNCHYFLWEMDPVPLI